jgi:hypothetical protein
MKKFLVLIFIGFFVSCRQAPKEEKIVDDIIAEQSSIDITTLDTASVDSITIKMESLLSNTENAHTKVKDIKKLKQENCNLKKELVSVKEELNQTKSMLKDSLNEPKKKKTFIQKVISTVKKDSI